MGTNILVVDDSEMMQKVIEKTINISDLDSVDIFKAQNGKQGLQILEENPMDLLIMDISMPVMNGLDMLYNVRQEESTKNLPILIVSSESNEERIKEIESKGATFIHKPFTPEVLRDKILDALSV